MIQHIGIDFQKETSSMTSGPWNVKKVAFGTIEDRLWYSIGAGCGSLIGLITSVLITNNIN